LGTSGSATRHLDEQRVDEHARGHLDEHRLDEHGAGPAMGYAGARVEVRHGEGDGRSYRIFLKCGMCEERIQGKIHVEHRPALRQVIASSVLGGLLSGSFRPGSGGSGGWVILDRPTIQFGDDLIIPNLAGFRTERAPRPTDEPLTTIIPDWICEILGPNRDTSVRVAKMLAYAREGVCHAWL